MSGPVTLPRPATGDYDPASAGYVSLVPDIDDPVRQLTAQRDRVLGKFWSVAEVTAGHRYAPGKWSVREVIGHMSDAERILAYRLLRIARGDETPLPGFDENTYVPAGDFDQRSLRDLLNEWTATRNATIALVRGLPREAWTRRGEANGKTVTASALAYIILGHVEHHLKVLNDRYGL